MKSSKYAFCRVESFAKEDGGQTYDTRGSGDEGCAWPEKEPELSSGHGSGATPNARA